MDLLRVRVGGLIRCVYDARKERDAARDEVERLRADRVEILADMVGLGHTVDMMRPVVEAAVAMTWDEPSLRRIDEAVDAYLAAQGEDDG
jgi:hypothetical protein